MRPSRTLNQMSVVVERFTQELKWRLEDMSESGWQNEDYIYLINGNYYVKYFVWDKPCRSV